jgi:hypothetical protein
VRDVISGIITRWAAENVYCVVLREDGSLDSEGTAECRKIERKRRLAEAKPYSEFMGEFSQKKPPSDALALYGAWPDPAAEKNAESEAVSTSAD